MKIMRRLFHRRPVLMEQDDGMDEDRGKAQPQGEWEWRVAHERVVF